ncbi:MAG: Hsp20/alpha crystallin family protein [Candidatus Pacearchaeota archaeon]|jgi:HSP20 family molecular chaperone IbpA|nr:Hsp20/alpha crystallin family protein [Clostridia bacterium]
MTQHRFILGNSPFEVLFKDFFNTESMFNIAQESKYSYPVDIKETKEGLQFDIAAIGLTSDDIDIAVESDILRVSNDKKSGDTVSDEDHYIHRGITRRSFNLGWKIGSQFDLKQIVAVMDKGLLTIKVPRSESAAPIKVNIQNK